MAADLARQLVEAGGMVHGRQDACWFFTSERQINFASPRVIVIYAQCVDALAQRY